MAFSSSFIRRSSLLRISIYLVALLNLNSFDFTNDVTFHSDFQQTMDFEKPHNMKHGHLTTRNSQFVVPKRSERANLILKSLTAILSTVAVALILVKCLRYLKPTKKSLKYRRLSEDSPCQDTEPKLDSPATPSDESKDIGSAENTPDEQDIAKKPEEKFVDINLDGKDEEATEEGTTDPLREALLPLSDSVNYVVPSPTCNENTQEHVVLSIGDETKNTDTISKRRIFKDTLKKNAKNKKTILIAAAAAITLVVIVALAVQLSQSKIANAELVADNMQLNVENLELSIQTGQMNETIGELNHEIDLLDEDIDRIQLNVDNLNRQLESKEILLEKTEAMVDQMQSRLGEAAKEHTDLIERSHAEKIELSELNLELSIENDLQKEKNANLTQKYTSLEAKATQLEQTISKLHADIDKLALEKETLTDKNSLLEREYEELQQQNESLMEANKELIRTANFKDSLKFQIDQLKELRLDVDEAWENFFRLQDINQSVEELQKKIDDPNYFLPKKTIDFVKELHPDEVQLIQEMATPDLLAQYQRELEENLYATTWANQIDLVNNKILAYDLRGMNEKMTQFFSVFSDFNNENFATFQGETQSLMRPLIGHMKTLTHYDAKEPLKQMRRLLHTYLNIARHKWV